MVYERLFWGNWSGLEIRECFWEEAAECFAESGDMRKPEPVSLVRHQGRVSGRGSNAGKGPRAKGQGSSLWGRPGCSSGGWEGAWGGLGAPLGDTPAALVLLALAAHRNHAGSLDATCSDLTDLGSEFLVLGLTWLWGWLKTPPVGDANVRPG